MIVERDYRDNTVHVTMGFLEFCETVEWLELIAPRDGATEEWRQQLRKIDPPEVPE